MAKQGAAAINRGLGLLLLGWLMLPAWAWGQTAPQPPIEPIETDRPDFIESNLAVPTGMLQLENGMTFGRSDEEGSVLFFPETLARYGIADKTELRLAVPNYFWSYGGTPSSGFGDLYLGAKRQLGPAKNGAGVALIPAMYLPIGNRGFTQGGIVPEIKVVGTYPLSDKWEVNAQVAVNWPRGSGTATLTVQPVVSLERQFTDNLKGFVEYVQAYGTRGKPFQLLHQGFAYTTTPNQQWDCHWGVGFSEVSPNFLVGIGYSLRF